MGIIQVNNIKLYAHHGCLEEEAKIGSEYRVDIEVKAALEKSSKTDELADTVDYVHLYDIVKQEMAIRSKLLEEVAQRILNRFFDEFPKIQKAKIAVAKINPPIGGNVEEVVIVLTKKNAKRKKGLLKTINCVNLSSFRFPILPSAGKVFRNDTFKGFEVNFE